MSRRRSQEALVLHEQSDLDRQDNPGAGMTVLWAAGAAAVAGGVTYFVLREIFTREVLNQCIGQLGNLGGLLPGQQGASPISMPTEQQVRDRISQIL